VLPGTLKVALILSHDPVEHDCRNVNSPRTSSRFPVCIFIFRSGRHSLTSTQLFRSRTSKWPFGSQWPNYRESRPEWPAALAYSKCQFHSWEPWDCPVSFLQTARRRRRCTALDSRLFPSTESVRLGRVAQLPCYHMRYKSNGTKPSSQSCAFDP